LILTGVKQGVASVPQFEEVGRFLVIASLVRS
jgi:hypothetical protein